MMKKKMKIMVALLAAIILLGFVSVLLLNQWHSRCEQLDKTDRFILKEYNTYVEKAETEEIWKDFALEDKTILALKGKFGNAYLINPQNEVRSIFAKKIRTPSQDQIEVYRISAISPQLFKVRKDGNFNTDGKKYRIYGQEVYYTRYDTATYVGIKAAAFVGYDFGVMYFDNVKDVPFSNLKLTVEAGAYDVRQLADRIPYESRALLCLLMDRLEIPDWQERLNKQTKEQALTQYDLIEDYVESL